MKMLISDDTKAVVNYLNNFSGGNLRKSNDLEVIIEICATYDSAETINRLIFCGKSVWNIASKLNKVNPAVEGIGILQKELERGCDEMKNYLIEIISKSESDVVNRFEDIYLQMTRGAVKNLIDLGHDLAKFKDLQSVSRQNKKNE